MAGGNDAPQEQDADLTRHWDDDGREALAHALARILWELRPYLVEIVVIGGWVPYLYQHYGPFPAWRGRLSLTAEVDVLLTRELPPGDRLPVAALLQAAGFAPVSDAAPAAVWANDPERGEKVEFLVPNAGPYRDLGRVVPIGAQRGIGAIALAALDILRRHTSALEVPAVDADGARRLVTVRVPRLGAYVVNKAATFLRRRPLGGGQTNPKQAKDLLYLRDLMHGGPAVVDVIERDIADILATDASSAQHVLDTAANSLDGAVRATSGRLAEVGAMLAEREAAWSRDAATANVAGHLTDLSDILLAFRSPAAHEADDVDAEDRDDA